MRKRWLLTAAWRLLHAKEYPKLALQNVAVALHELLFPHAHATRPASGADTASH